jgi:hypothetical protein
MNFKILRHGFCAEHAQLADTWKFPQKMCEVDGMGGSLKETCSDLLLRPPSKLAK